MGLLLLLLLGAGLGWAARSQFEKSLSSNECVLLGLTGGVLVGFMIDLAQTGSRHFTDGTLGSILMAGFGATLSVLVRRLLMERGS